MSPKPKQALTEADILSQATQRRHGVVLPLPAAINPASRNARKILTRLITTGSIEERPASATQPVWRVAADGKRYTLRLTKAGEARLATPSAAAAPAATESQDGAAAPALEDGKAGTLADSAAPADTGAHPAPTTASMSHPPVPAPSPPPMKPKGKLGQVLAALRQGEGASLAELIALTGWQAHTIRASISRLRQTGVPIAFTEHGGLKCYAIAEAGHAD